MLDEPELTFEALRTRKPKRGKCMRCFENPTGGYLQIQVLPVGSTSSALVSMNTTLCRECLELMYRAIATSMAQPVMFGKNICPRCQKERPIVGRIQLMAKLQKGDHKAGGYPAYTSIAHSSYTYCESCTVYAYQSASELRDQVLTEGHPVSITTGES